MIRKFLTSAIIATITWVAVCASPPALAQQSNDASLSIEQSLKRLDAFMELIEALRGHIDRSQFDLDALLEDLDFDADRIIEFVSKDILFEQYSGLLRGAKGTLMSRAGNSLDQSTLLAKLLNDAGYEARIVRGKLPTEATQQLVGQLGKLRNDPGIFSNGPDAVEIYKQLLTLGGLSGDTDIDIEDLNRFGGEQFSELRSATESEASLINAKLDNAGVQLEPSHSVQDIQREASDYFWVQYRPDTSDWKAIHPAFGATDYLPVPSPDETYSATIPGALQHKVRLQVFMERSIGQSIEVVPVSNDWERPAANLIYAPVVYSNTPFRAPDSIESPQALYADSDYFIPTLNGVAASDVAFDIKGNTVPMMVMKESAAEFFGTVSGQVDSAAAAISSLGTQAGSKQTTTRKLRALWMEIEVTNPNGQARSYRQDIWPNGDSRCENTKTEINCTDSERLTEIRRALVTQSSLAIATGSFPQAYSLERILQRMINNRSLIRGYLRSAGSPDLDEWSNVKDIDTDWLAYSLLFDSFDQFESTARIYRSAPTLVMFQQAFNHENKLSYTLDILSNRKRAFKSTPGGVASARNELIKVGVWETLMENIYLAQNQQDALNRALPIQRSGVSRDDIDIIRDFDTLEKLDVSEQTRQSMYADISQGYALIVPKQTGSISRQEISWFRVDLSNGETLGMTIDGRGGAILEWIGASIVGLTVIAPIYVVGCLLVGGELNFCIFAVGKTASTIVVGASTMALAVFMAILLSPSEAH